MGGEFGRRACWLVL